MDIELQKASMWKRISAFLFDGILLGILAVLLAWLLATALGYDAYASALDERYAHYGEQYGVNLRMSLTEYDQLDKQQQQIMQDATDALNRDGDALYASQMTVQLSIVTVSLALLMAFLVWEFTLPLILSNGQTLGKKIFAIGLMRSDYVRVNNVTLFVRAILGKYTVETMIPVLLLMRMYFGSGGVLGVVIFAVLARVQLCLLLFSQRHAPLHDFLASTVCVDVASQRIFDTKEDMLAFKAKRHEEKLAAQAAR